MKVYLVLYEDPFDESNIIIKKAFSLNCKALEYINDFDDNENYYIYAFDVE